MNVYESIKENLKESGWMTYQNRIEDTLEEAKNELDEDRFSEFCEGVINICQNYLGDLAQYDMMDSEDKEDEDTSNKADEIKAKIKYLEDKEEATTLDKAELYELYDLYAQLRDLGLELEECSHIPEEHKPFVEQGKCPYCTGPMTKEEYKVFGMCKNCYDNGVE